MELDAINLGEKNTLLKHFFKKILGKGVCDDMKPNQKRRKFTIKNSTFDNDFQMLIVDSTKKTPCIICETLFNSVCLAETQIMLICKNCKTNSNGAILVFVTNGDETIEFNLLKMCKLGWFKKCNPKITEFFGNKQVVALDTNKLLKRDAILYNGLHLMLYPEDEAIPPSTCKISGYSLFSPQIDWNDKKIYDMLSSFAVDCFNEASARLVVEFSVDDVLVSSNKISVPVIKKQPHARAAVLFIQALSNEPRLTQKHKHGVNIIYEQMKTHCTKLGILKDVII